MPGPHQDEPAITASGGFAGGQLQAVVNRGREAKRRIERSEYGGVADLASLEKMVEEGEMAQRILNGVRRRVDEHLGREGMEERK